jgi:hypothetical protein
MVYVLMKRQILFVFVLCLSLAAGSLQHARALPGDPVPLDDYPVPCTDQSITSEETEADAEPVECIVANDTDTLPPSAIEMRAAATGVPDPMDVLPLRPIEQTVQDAVVHYFARVITDDAPIYDAPAGSVIGSTGTGFIFYSTHHSQEAAGEMWTMVNPGEWIRQADLQWRDPSAFKGVYIDDYPEREFAWMLDPHHPLASPGGLPNKDASFLERYQMVVLYATAWVDGWRYYMVAPDQWVRESWLGKVKLNAPPEDVSGKWIDIDLYEQTLVAYEDERPVYATLVASGLEEWSTTEGLYQVYYKVANGPMSGAHGEPDYYYLENVPWSLYFNEGAAIHGAYWHDGFGYRRSHGCVNVAAADAMWMFEWAEEGTWVHVHSSDDYR